MEQLAIAQFKLLPEPLQAEALHYIQYLLQVKYQPLTSVSKPEKANSLTFSDFHLPDSGQPYSRFEIYPVPPRRNPGWGKHIFLYVAPDFDATPEGFEEYMPAT